MKQNETKNEEKHSCCKKKLKLALKIIVALVILRAIWMFGIMPIGYTIQSPAATATSTCPTTDTVSGSGSYTTGNYATAAAADAAANALLQGRSNTEAGLAKNGYTCPNPACQKKSLGSITEAAKAGYPTASAWNFWAAMGTVFDLFQKTYYSSEMEYTWSATIVCR